ncbi:hypothetical protein [Cryptosporangium aurantiacum]|uniref:Uncharacterized protein n=1 Tax=Cryptosporangium aurantiacum TaxID=134849 RepID=A0A1M7PSU2_9ACTN|nr:hypothetical protein [Cryptosporangium aurantiacum]SHN20521.1 hypothetical protein SAMN05443668_103649 [Cryptosporangium aurantiacum]
MIVVLIEHPDGGVYGPWELADDGSHYDEIQAFLRRWHAAHDDAEPTQVTVSAGAHRNPALALRGVPARAGRADLRRCAGRSGVVCVLAAAVAHSARRVAFTPEVAATSLALTPYHLRYAGVTTMLRGGMQPKDVADLVGNSLKVLLEIYAQILDGGEAERRRQHQASFGYRPGARTHNAHNQWGAVRVRRRGFRRLQG